MSCLNVLAVKMASVADTALNHHTLTHSKNLTKYIAVITGNISANFRQQQLFDLKYYRRPTIKLNVIRPIRYVRVISSCTYIHGKLNH